MLVIVQTTECIVFYVVFVIKIMSNLLMYTFLFRNTNPCMLYKVELVSIPFLGKRDLFGEWIS